MASSVLAVVLVAVRTVLNNCKTSASMGSWAAADGRRRTKKCRNANSLAQPAALAFGCGAAAARSEFPESQGHCGTTSDVVVVGSHCRHAANESIDRREANIMSRQDARSATRHHGFWDQRPAHARAARSRRAGDDSPRTSLKGHTLQGRRILTTRSRLACAVLQGLESFFEYIRKPRLCEFALHASSSCGEAPKIALLAPLKRSCWPAFRDASRCTSSSARHAQKNTIVDEIIKDETGCCSRMSPSAKTMSSTSPPRQRPDEQDGRSQYYRAEKGIVFGAGGSFVNDRICSLIIAEDHEEN